MEGGRQSTFEQLHHECKSLRVRNQQLQHGRVYSLSRLSERLEGPGLAGVPPRMLITLGTGDLRTPSTLRLTKTVPIELDSHRAHKRAGVVF